MIIDFEHMEEKKVEGFRGGSGEDAIQDSGMLTEPSEDLDVNCKNA